MLHVAKHAQSRVNSVPQRQKFRNEESMNKAYEEVLSGQTLRVAAEKYEVPKSTLYDCVSGKVTLQTRSGPERYWSDEEKHRLAKWLLRCASIGYAKSKKEMLAIVDVIIAKKQGKEMVVSKGYWESFRHRHLQLTIRCTENSCVYTSCCH